MTSSARSPPSPTVCAPRMSLATQPSTLLEVPAESLRSALDVPEVKKLVLSTLYERLYTLDQPDLPRLALRHQPALGNCIRACRARRLPKLS